MNLKEVLGYVPLIIGDGGHGEDTPGKRTPEFPDGSVIQEYEFNKSTVKKFLEKAKALGFEVLNVAEEKQDVSLRTRTDRANDIYKKHMEKYPNAPKEKLVVYVSFHYNAQDEQWGGSKGGVEVYHYPGAKDGEELAKYILRYLVQGREQRNRGVKSANFHVLRETIMTAVLIEAGFMDYKKEAEWMLDEAFQEEVAEEALKGCCEYFGVNYEESGESPINEDKEEMNELRQKIKNLEEDLNKKEGELEQIKEELKNKNTTLSKYKKAIEDIRNVTAQL